MKKFTFTVILSILLFSALSCEKTKEELTKECKKLISKKEYKDAKEVCQNACKKGSGLGCYFSARLEKNYEKMKNLLDKACNLQFGHNLAYNVIGLYISQRYYQLF